MSINIKPLLAMGLGALLMAASTPSSAAWVRTAQFKITALENHWFHDAANNGVELFASITLHTSGCGTGYPERLWILKDHAQYKEIFAIAMSAHLSGRYVEAVFDPAICTAGGRARVMALKIINP